MDGLELTERLIAKYPEVKVILMTSLEEFEFAKKALKLKVFDYLLKLKWPCSIPLTVLPLNTVGKRQSGNKYSTAAIAAAQFWEHLISGRFEETELATESEFLGIDLHAVLFTTIVIKIDDYHSPKIRNRFGQEMLKFCVGNITEEMTRHLRPVLRCSLRW